LFSFFAYTYNIGRGVGNLSRWRNFFCLGLGLGSLGSLGSLSLGLGSLSLGLGSLSLGLSLGLGLGSLEPGEPEPGPLAT
jgi:hypothetical protein